MFSITPINIYGAVTVTLMMLAYVAEGRGRVYSLLFGCTCISASAYGWLSGTWPFGIIEAIWALFAIRKWHRRSGEKKSSGPV